MDADAYCDALRPEFEGRKVVVIGATVTGLAPTAKMVRQLGATEVLIVSLAGYGVGAPIPIDVAQTFEVSLPPAATMIDTLRQEEAFKADPSAELIEALHRFDPHRSALVIGQFVNTVSHLDGRKFLAFRRPEWLLLEDKTVVDAFWDRAGIERAQAVVCDVESGTLRRASGDIDFGDGVVWSGDSREGFNGAAEYVHVVRNDAEFEAAMAFFSQRCDRVRIMPFLEGIPCSIHGVVFPDYVAAVRPIEMVVLRRNAPLPGQGVFAYTGCASFYDPPDEVRAQMIEVAKRVGDRLRTEINFRGCFTVDGVATKDGFLPTELNPRLGAGLSTVLAAAPDVPFALLFDALVAGTELSIDPVVFERDVQRLADETRAGGSWGPAGPEVISTKNRPAVFVNGAWRWATKDERPAGLVSSGLRSARGYARVMFQPDVIPAGPSVGSMAVAFWEFATSELNAGIGPMVSAVDCVR